MLADRVTKAVLALGLGLTCLVVTPTVAAAQESPLQLQVEGRFHQGGYLSVTSVDHCDDGDESTPGGEVTATLLRGETVVEEFTPQVGSDGLWGMKYAFPLDAIPGSYTFEAECVRPGGSTVEPYEDATFEVEALPVLRAEVTPSIVKPGDVATATAVDQCYNLLAPRWTKLIWSVWYLGPDGSSSPVEVDVDFTYSLGPPDPAVPHMNGNWILAIVAPQAEGTYVLKAACFQTLQPINQHYYSGIYTPVPFVVDKDGVPVPPGPAAPAPPVPGRPQFTG